MPTLTNICHEIFANELSKGKTADEAYELAGYVRNSIEGRRKDQEARVAELLEQGAQRTLMPAIAAAAAGGRTLPAKIVVDRPARIIVGAQRGDRGASHFLPDIVLDERYLDRRIRATTVNAGRRRRSNLTAS